MSIFLWTIAIAVVTAIACSLCGALLVVRREAFYSEGLSHAVLPGMVVAFTLFRDRGSLGLILAAAASGMLMVWLVHLICRSGRVDQDAALGIVFSGLFSGGVVLSNLELRNVHFHAHCIIDGNLATAALKSFEIGGVSLGPTSFVSMTLILVVLIGFLFAFFKPLKLAAFDQPLAELMGLRPGVLRLIWLSLVSATAVAAFETAGTVLVVALMIAPAATANLFTHSLAKMLWLSAAIGAASAVAGVYLASWLDISPAGPISAVVGGGFLLSVAFAPRVGWFAQLQLRLKQRRECLQSLTLQLIAKSTVEVEAGTTLSAWVAQRIAAPMSHVTRAVESCLDRGWIEVDGSRVSLTDTGNARLSEV